MASFRYQNFIILQKSEAIRQAKDKQDRQSSEIAFTMHLQISLLREPKMDNKLAEHEPEPEDSEDDDFYEPFEDEAQLMKFQMSMRNCEGRAAKV